MSKQTELERAFDRLLRRFPPKHPDRKRMRAYELERQRANQAPVVDTNGYTGNRVTSGTVDWAKQDRIKVGIAGEGGRRKKPDGTKQKKQGR